MRSSLAVAIGIAVLAALPRVGHADDPQDVPSTLSPRATKQTESEPTLVVQPTAEAKPVVKTRRPLTTVELVKARTPIELQRRLGTHQTNRTTGMLLVGAGTASLVASTIVWSVLALAPPEKPAGNTIDQSFGYRVGGIVTLVIGGLFAVPGAIVWGVSDRHLRRDSKEVGKILEQVQREQASGFVQPVEPKPEAPKPEAKPELEPVPSDRPLFR